MLFHRLLLPALVSAALASTLPGAAIAQQGGSQTQRAANVQATTDMRSRIAAAIDRVSVTEQHGKISPARSAAVRRQLAGAQTEMASLARRQGFVSAAELASYGRLVVAVDAELGAGASGHAYGNDALPSAEVTAFQRVHARLNDRDARIEYDANNCAIYQGTTQAGKIRREPLRDPAGRPICARR